jgi:hypothetical protein
VFGKKQKLHAMRIYDPPTATAIYASIVEPTESTDDWQATCQSFVVLVDLLLEQENSEGNRIANLFGSLDFVNKPGKPFMCISDSSVCYSLQDLGFIPTHFVTFFIGMLVRFI